MLGCVQDVIRKNNFLDKFEEGQKREMSSGSLLYVCSKEEVCLDIDEPISGLPPK